MPHARRRLEADLPSSTGRALDTTPPVVPSLAPGAVTPPQPGPQGLETFSCHETQTIWPPLLLMALIHPVLQKRLTAARTTPSTPQCCYIELALLGNGYFSF